MLHKLLYYEAMETKSDPPLNVDRATVRAGFTTVISFVAFLIAVVASATFSWSSLTTQGESLRLRQEDLSDRFASTSTRLTTLSERVQEQGSKIESVIRSNDDAKYEMREIRAKIDFLVAQEIISAQNPEQKRHLQEAANRVRSSDKSRGASGDPLGDLGL
jgi:hypothetical protein